MSLDGSDKCPICGKNFSRAEPIGDAYRVSCGLCGTYEVSGTAWATLRGEHAALLPYLSAHTRQTQEFEGRIVQVFSNWPSLAEVHQHTSVHQRAEKLLRVIELRTKQPGEFVTIDRDGDYPLIDAVDAGQLDYFLKHWKELGCIEDNIKTFNVVRLTVKGWERLDPASGGAGIRGRVFIAMSFDRSLDEVYEQGIKAAIEGDCQMTPIRVDKVQHDEKICDLILAEIRRAQFVVADVTQQKPGVYFEAGFAMGLGRRVIWCCREDEKDKLHFDTRQYPHLLWTDAVDLRRRLADRIQARIPR